MNLIEKTASPPRKLDTILFHIYNYLAEHEPKSGAVAVIDTHECYTRFGCEYFGLSSWGEMKFYLDALIDKHLIEVPGSGTLACEEYHRKINFPKKIRVWRQGSAGAASERPEATSVL